MYLLSVINCVGVIIVSLLFSIVKKKKKYTTPSYFKVCFKDVLCTTNFYEYNNIFEKLRRLARRY